MSSEAADSPILTESQIKQLESNFKSVTKNPDATTVMLIAAECSMTEEDTAKWFKERNAKWRQEQGFPPLKGSVLD